MPVSKPLSGQRSCSATMDLILRPPRIEDEAAVRLLHEQLAVEGFAFLPADGSWEHILSVIELKPPVSICRQAGCQPISLSLRLTVKSLDASRSGIVLPTSFSKSAATLVTRSVRSFGAEVMPPRYFDKLCSDSPL